MSTSSKVRGLQYSICIITNVYNSKASRILQTPLKQAYQDTDQHENYRDIGDIYSFKY